MKPNWQRPTQSHVYKPSIESLNPGEIKGFISKIISGESIENIKMYQNETQLGFDIADKDGNTLIHHILEIPNKQLSESQKLKIIKEIYKTNIIFKPNKKNITPLHLSCKYQYEHITDFLLKKLKNPIYTNEVDSIGKTPLHYLLQPVKHACKNTKVGTLIKTKIKEEQANELKTASNNIISILQNGAQVKYLRHIKNSLQNIGDIFPLLFSEMYENTINEFTKTLGTKTLNTEKDAEIKKNIIENKLTSLYEELLNKNFKLSLNRLDIKLGNNGWNGVLEYNNTDEMIQKLISYENINEIKTMWTNDNFLLANINLIDEKLEHIYTSIRSIIFFNEALHSWVNANGMGANADDYCIDRARLIELFGDDGMGIVNMSVNQVDIRVLNDLVKDMIGYGVNSEPIVKLTKDKRFAKLNQLTLAEQALRVNQTPINDFNNNPIPFPQADYSPNFRYFCSYIQMASNVIKKYINLINTNIETIFTHLQNENEATQKLYPIYIELSRITITILNIIQYLIIIERTKSIISEKIRKLTDISTKIQNNGFNHPNLNNPANPINYSYEYIKDHINTIEKHVEDIITNFNDIYEKNIIKLYNNLNRIIKYLNSKSSIKYIKHYFDQTVNYQLNPINELNNIWDRQFLPFKIVPNKLNNYINENYINSIDITNNNSINNMIKLIFELYVPVINNKNYSKYYTNNFDNTFNGTIYNDNINAPLPMYNLPPVNRESRIGFTIGYPNPLPPPYPTIKYNDPNLPELIAEALPNPGALGINRSLLRKTREETVITSISERIDAHFATLKFMLIQNLIDIYINPNPIGIPPPPLAAAPSIVTDAVLRNAINTNRVDINGYIDRFNVEENNQVKEGILRIIIGQLADEIITQIIKENIWKGCISYFNTKLSTNLPNRNLLNILLPKSDTGFKLNFNEIINKQIRMFFTNILTLPPYERLMYTGIIMENEDEIKQIYGNNREYKLFNKECITYNPAIITLLHQYNLNPNIKDIYGLTPIFYAIDLMIPNIIQTLITYGAYVKIRGKNYDFVNKLNQTPFEYFNSLFSEEMEKNINITEFYNPFYEELKLEIIDNPDNKNNLIRNLNVAFGQIILMINHYFYNNIIGYTNPNKWRNQDTEDLKDILENFGNYPKLRFNSNEYEFLLQTNYSDLVNDVLTVAKKDVLNAATKKYDIEQQLAEMTAHFATLRSVHPRTPEIRRQMIDLRNKINILRPLRPFPEVNQFSHLNTNEIYHNNNLAPHINSHIGLFKLSPIYNSSDVGVFYNGVFSEIIENLKDYAINPDRTVDNYLLYQNMWKTYIESGLYHNKFGITTLLNNTLVNSRTPLTVTDIEPIRKLYNNIFIPIINDYNDLSQTYLEDNYVLKDMVGILTHVVRYNLCSSLYMAIVKTITKYVSKNHTEVTLINTVNDLLKDRNGNSKLKNYIIGDLPLSLIKLSLQIFDNEYDTLKNSSIKVLLGSITNIVMTSYSVLSKDSTLIRALEMIYPFYENTINLTIQKMKKMVDEYLFYSKSIGIMLEIYIMMLNVPSN